MQSVLIFDTETTGKFDFKAPIDAPHQPKIVQLAFTQVDENAVPKFTYSAIIAPTHFKEIPVEATNIHGISIEDCHRYGIQPLEALVTMLRHMAAADAIVAHNINFDWRILSHAIGLCGLQDSEFWLSARKKNQICTMLSSTDFVGIPNQWRSGFKWPTLQELHTKLFGHGFSGAHDALIDITATRDCFFELLKQGVLNGGKNAA